MSEQVPPVVDLENLLKPIAGENPAGEAMRYAGVYDEIAEARRADDTLSQGEWQTELKVADFQKVIDLSIPVLLEKSKDLQIAAWLAEGLIKRFGFAGLRDGLKLLAGLQDNFWDTLYPEIEEGDMEGRGNAVSWLDSAASFAIKDCAITAGRGCSFNGYEESKVFDFTGTIDSENPDPQENIEALRSRAEAENRVTSDIWRAALASSNRAFYETLNSTLDECDAALGDLNRVNEEKYDRNQTPGLSLLNKSLDDVHSLVKKLLEEKRLEEPGEADYSAEGESGESAASDGSAPGSASGPVQSRKDAIRRLAEIAAFFQRTEPHSPVAYLVQRAVKWGNMPLENWLQDVIKDETVLYQLRQTLGLNTGGVPETSEAPISSDQ